jgi:hypothetical protein
MSVPVAVRDATDTGTDLAGYRYPAGWIAIGRMLVLKTTVQYIFSKISNKFLNKL